MKILLAGATGAIGQPLIHLLISKKHDVYGITQSKERAALIAAKGATPVILNILEKEAVDLAVAEIAPDVIIDMLTHLPKEYTPDAMREASVLDAKVRLEGGAHLLSASQKYGVKRYIAQSSAFWYARGKGLADESISFAFDASPGIAAGTRVYAEIERRILTLPAIEGVAMRFGFFYGPGTWFYPEGNMAEQLRKKQFSGIGRGEGIWNFVHIEDAAKAVVAALLCPSGAYNIVNDYPSAMNKWLPHFASYVGAEAPSWISEEEGLKESGADAVYYATQLRGASNKKAKEVLAFKPRTFEWFQ